MNKILGIMGVVGLLFAGCSSEDDILSSFHNDPDAVHITAEVGKASADGFTRSNPLGDAQKQKQFNENDEISVKADGQEAVTYKFSGTEWVPQSGKFLKWESDEMNFTANYPAFYNGGEITQPLEFPTEKSLADADFMTYTGKQSNTNGNQLTLTMERQMARVVVEIVKFNDQYAQNTTVNSVTINGVKAYKHNDNKFYALIKPCSNQDDQEFLSLNVGEGNTETLKRIPALEAGKSYTYQLTVGKNKVVVTGITVKDWTSGETLGGKAELDARPYLTFTAEGAQTFKMKEYYGYTISGLQYSVNEGEWKNVVAGEEVSFGGTNSTLRLRGTNIYGTASAPSEYSTITFDPYVNVSCTGDIRTLLDYKNYKTVDTKNAKFCNLFKNCTALTSAPDLPATTLASCCYGAMFFLCTNLVNAPALPAETLADECYSAMFFRCTNLVNAPALPAETLEKGCYNAMFNGCISLTSAPKLPAKTLAYGCYMTMFYGCTNLESAPDLPATELKESCYYGMFRDCTKIKTAPTLSATTLENACYGTMFKDCTNLETAPALPAETLKDNCYSEMFAGCKKLSSVTMSAPSDQITGTSNCCINWLKDAGTGATSRTLKVTDVDAYNALAKNSAYLPDNWKKGAAGTDVQDVPYVTFSAAEAQRFTLSSTGYFPVNIEYSVGTGDWKTLGENETVDFGGNLGNLQLRGTNNLNGTSNYVPGTADAHRYIYFSTDAKVACTGDIRTLLDYKTYKTVSTSTAQFYQLFYLCEELTSAPDLPATRLADYCYYGMFGGCTSLTKAPELPAQELAAGCYAYMFDGCTSLQKAPKLSATELAEWCYSNMFQNCTNLSSVTMLAPSDKITSTENCCYDWLAYAGKGAASRTLIVKDKAAYNALKGGLPTEWKIGNCTVLAEDNSTITE